MSFDRLSPALQYQIPHTLRFAELRPVQSDAIDAVLDDKNVVVLAPTAGGKTEAAFFPLLSAMDTQDWTPVSVLYLSPIRALLNNQEPRLERLAGVIGRRVFKWHGDVKSTARKRFLQDPADILLLTPEALEAMLMSPRVPARELFAGLRAVVVDEIHSFADDDRGAHLSALLERIQRFCGRDVQRIGLSATVGNPPEILSWLQGSSKREATVVDPGGAKSAPELTLDYVGGDESAAQVIEALHPGQKRLVFVDSRRLAESIGQLLLDRGVKAYVLHGSLSAAERRDTERAFAEDRDCVIVATSALELGIDVGDLDRVLQINAPSAVASFLQRMGRTGRRSGKVANCTFLATKESAVLHAAALIDLYRHGFVEPVRPSRRASHILAHQLMSLGVQLSGAPVGDWWAWIAGAESFAGLDAQERESVLRHMLERDILADQGGRLWLGTEGEKQYGRANFRKLYAVFEAPRDVSVRYGPDEIGTVEAYFLMRVFSESEHAAFTLAGRQWDVVTVDWERGICVVRPAHAGRAPRWLGSPRYLSYEVCQAMRQILTNDLDDPSWSRPAREVIKTKRAEMEFLREEPFPLRERGREITWWTYAGGKANALMAAMFEAELGKRCVSRNESITLDDEAGKSLSAVRDTLFAWHASRRPTLDDAAKYVRTDGHRVSKFAACLPDKLLRELVLDAMFDVEGARRVVEEIRG